MGRLQNRGFESMVEDRGEEDVRSSVADMSMVTVEHRSVMRRIVGKSEVEEREIRDLRREKRVVLEGSRAYHSHLSKLPYNSPSCKLHR